MYVYILLYSFDFQPFEKVFNQISALCMHLLAEIEFSQYPNQISALSDKLQNLAKKASEY